MVSVDRLTVFKAYSSEKKLDSIVVPVSVRGSSTTKKFVNIVFRIQN